MTVIFKAHQDPAQDHSSKADHLHGGKVPVSIPKASAHKESGQEARRNAQEDKKPI